jgi:asparagine synthase (glutamine-hydrolysing)
MLRGMDAHWANRIKNMVHRGLMPNPDRFYSDDSFASDHFEDMLAPDFRARVDRDDSLNVQREIFARAGTRSELHRLMYLDLQMTIAESDVVKVVRSAKMAGIDVAFPYLDAGLVAYTGRLPDQHKVKVLKKRHLFKLAMADILPVEIIKKKKQGFGLPIAVWMREKGAMRELVNDVLGSARARERGYVQPAFVQQLLQTHERGSWDYASEIFRLLMLELWHREYLDAQA